MSASNPERPEQPVDRIRDRCKVEVRANQLGWFPIIGDYYHMFIVYTDETGTEYFLRGGPGAGGPGSSGVSGEMSGGSSGNSSEGSSGSGSNSSASSDSGGGGPWGSIVTEYGEYLPGTIDWNPEAKKVTVLEGEEACDKYSLLIAEVDAIERARIRYNPLGPNSNSTVFTSLRRVGITPLKPAGVTAPGDETHLDY